MKNTTQLFAGMALIVGATAAAQNPPAPAGPPQQPPMAAGPQMGGPTGGPIGAGAAQMLLAQSAQLDLTDAQIVKLAGIARKADGRQRARQAAMDSARARFMQPGDSLARRQFAQRMQADMTKERDQAHADLRDAIATLTPDQQAKAWEMAATRGRAGRGMGGQGGMGGGGMGRGRGMDGQRGQGGMGGRGGMGGVRRPGGQMGPDQMGPDEMGPGGQMGPGNQMGPGARRGGATRPRAARPPVGELPPASVLE